MKRGERPGGDLHASGRRFDTVRAHQSGLPAAGGNGGNAVLVGNGGNGGSGTNRGPGGTGGARRLLFGQNGMNGSA